MEDNRRKNKKNDIDKWFRITYIRATKDKKRRNRKNRLNKVVKIHR